MVVCHSYGREIVAFRLLKFRFIFGKICINFIYICIIIISHLGHPSFTQQFQCFFSLFFFLFSPVLFCIFSLCIRFPPTDKLDPVFFSLLPWYPFVTNTFFLKISLFVATFLLKSLHRKKL